MLWHILLLVATVASSATAQNSCFSDDWVQCECRNYNSYMFTATHWRDSDGKWGYEVEATNSDCNETEAEQWLHDTYSRTTSEQSMIRNGYQRLGNGLYKFHGISRTWENARRTCEEEGAHLAIINSEYEAGVLRELYRNYPDIENVHLNDYLFIGFHDMYNEGEYLTIYGQPIAKTGYNRWEGVEPNNYFGDNNGNPGEDCGGMHRDGGLNDLPCDFLGAFICELEDKSEPLPYNIDYSAGKYKGVETVIKPQPGKTLRTDPGEGYEYFPGIGFYRLHTITDVWENARRTCEKEGAHLAIVNSESEAQVLIEMFKQRPVIVDTNWSNTAFIGFHDQYNEGEYLTIYGEPLTTTGYYRWWDSSNPDDKVAAKYHSGQDCGGFHRNGGYDDLACNMKYAFFCEKELSK